MIRFGKICSEVVGWSAAVSGLGMSIAGLLYGSLLDPSCWQRFLNRASAEVGGSRMQMHGWTNLSGSSFAITSGYDPEMIVKYNEKLSKLNPWSRAIVQAPEGVVLPSQKLCREGDLKKTIFYEEWVRPQENISVGAGVVIARTPSGPFMFGGNIRERDQESKQPELIGLMNRLVPHVTLAWRLGHALWEPRLRILAMDKTLVASRAALILLRTDRTIAFADSTGEEMLVSGEQCKLDHLGRFAFRYEVAERAMAQALKDLQRSDSPVALRVPGGVKFPDIYLFGLDYRDVESWPLANLINLPQKNLLCIMSLSKPIEAKTTLSAFGLTPAEIKIAEAIAGGEPTADIAAKRGVSIATIRSQVQSIYSKCDIHNRAALAAIMLGSHRR